MLSPIMKKIRPSGFVTGLLGALLLSVSAQAAADVGTLSFYKRPYYPTECNISQERMLGLNYWYVQVSEGQWNNGASCGQKLAIRCLTGPGPRNPCTHNTIQAVIVGRCPNGVCAVGNNNVTMRITAERYSSLVNSPRAAWASIEFAPF